MKKSNRGNRKSWQRKLVTLAVASCFAAEVAHAAPTLPFGPTVINGQVFFNYNGNLLQISNSPGAIVNWQGFSIGVNDLVRILQQSPSSYIMNRVTGGNPSDILGSLWSNGRVLLINPSGITFGAGAQINTAGLVASTLALSDSDFLAGRYRFTEVPGAGSITNQGSITTSSGGSVYLIAPSIENSGIIRSDNGEILLAAGKSVELVSPNSPDMRVQITAPDNQVVNLGQIIAQGGRIGIYGGLIRQGGVVNANTAVMGPNGKIVFKATKDVKLDAGSVTTASGTANGGGGGAIAVEGETITNAGTVQANAADNATAGSISMVAQNNLTLDSTSRIEAKGADVNSQGGSVYLYSYGNANALAGQVIDFSGGTTSGNAGSAEFSALRNGYFAGSVIGNAAPGYRAGSFLMDPLNASIGPATISVDTTVDAGDNITIAGAVAINATRTLTLLADHKNTTPGTWDDGTGPNAGTVGVGAITDAGGFTITGANNTSSLVMFAGGGGIGTSGAPVLTAMNGGGITVNTNNPAQVGAAKTFIQNNNTGMNIAGITAAGGANDNSVSITSGGAITQSGAIAISGAATTGLELLGGGTFTLNGPGNNVPLLAANLSGAGNLSYRQAAGGLDISTVNSTSGITTAGGSVDVRTLGAGTLTATGAIATSGGPVTLNSQDALAVNGGITAGAGAVNLLANQDGLGAQGFSQADATTISGTGIAITVNTAGTAAGVGGGAVVSNITDAGALNITTNNSTNDSTGNITRAATSTLGGTSLSLTTGTGSIGTGTGAAAINLAAGQTGVTANTHGSSIFLAGSGALTTGAVNTSMAGTAGGLVNISAAGALNTGTIITAGGAATTAGLAGGDVTLASTGSTLTVTGAINSSGSAAASGSNPGGNSGNVNLSGANGVTLNNNLTAVGGAGIGGGLAGNSGTIALTSASGAVTGAGVSSTLNTLTATASTGINLNGNNLVTGLVTLNNTNGTPSGNIFYTSANSGGTIVTGTNAAAGGSFNVTETTATGFSVAAGGITTKGGAVNLAAQGAGALLTVTGNIDTTNAGGTAAGASVTLTADDMALVGTTNAGSGANTVILQPNAANRTINITAGSTGQLDLSPAEIQTVSVAGGTLQLGPTTGTGDINLNATLANTNVNAATLRLISGRDVNITGGQDIGAIGTEFNHHLELKANNNVNITNGNVYLANNKNLTVVADNDTSGAGSVNVGGDIIQVGTGAGNTTGFMSIQGQDLNFALSGGGSATIAVTGAGAQTFTGKNSILIDNTTGGTLSVTVGSGLQTFDTSTATGSGNMTVQGSPSGVGTGSVIVSTGAGGTQNFNLKGGLTVQSLSGSNATATAALSADAGQTITAKFVEVIGQGAALATINNDTTTGNATNQVITVSGVNGSGESVVVKALGAGGATIQNGIAASTGQQNITVNGAGANLLRVIGTSGNATIVANGTGVAGNQQNISVTGGASNTIEVGDVAGGLTAGTSSISGRNQTVTAGVLAEIGAIKIRGGTAAGKNSGISNISGTQTVSTTGTMTLTGGTATGTAGTCNPAQSGSCAEIVSSGAALQTVSANTIQLVGGSGGVANIANIRNNAGAAEINAGSGGLSLQAGSGVSDNSASIGSSINNIQTITVNVLGDTTLTGGSTTGSGALIGVGGTGDLQIVTVDFNGTGNLTLTGGAGPNGASIGSGSSATNTTTNLTIDAANITLDPGAGSGSRLGHSAANPGPGNIVVTATGNIALNGGAIGTAIRTTGDVTLQAAGAGKTITEQSSGSIVANTLTATADAGVSLTSASNAVSNIAITNNTSGAVSFRNSTALDIAVAGITNTGRNVTLNNTGAVTDSGSISAAGLELLGSGPYTLDNAANSVTTLAANTTGAISYVNAGALTVGAVNTTGITSGNNNVTINAGGTVAVTQNITAGTGFVSITTTGATSNIDGGGGTISSSNSGATGITLNAGGGIGVGAAVNTDVTGGAGGKIYLTTNGVGAAGNETLVEAGPVTFGPAGNVNNVAFNGTGHTVTVTSTVGPITINSAGGCIQCLDNNFTLITGAGDILLQNTGAAIDFGTGTLRAVSAGAITQSVGSAIKGTALGARAVNAIDMNQPGNDFGTIAAAVSGLNQSVTYNDANGFTLGTVGADITGAFLSTTGITTNNGNVTLTAGNTMTLSTPLAISAGTGTVGLTTTAGNIDFTGAGPGATLSAGAVTLNAAAAVTSGGAAATDIDTSANNGTITVTGTSIGTGPNPLEVNPGTGSMNFTATTGGMFVDQSVGNLLFSKLTTVSQAGVGQTRQFSTTNGSIALDNYAGFDPNTADDNPTVIANGATSDITVTASSSLMSGNVTGTAGRNIALNVANSVNTSGNVTLTAGGTISDNAGVGSLKGALLTTTSVGGTTLNGANQVTSFNGTNSGSGNIQLTNTAAPLTITGISQAGGGNVTVINTGGITLNGTDTVTGGNLTLTATGGVINQTGGIISANLLTTSSTGGTTLNNANTVSSFNATNITGGNVALTNTAAPLAITGISQAGGGNVTVNNTGAVNFSGAATVTGGNLNVTATGAVTQGAVALTGNTLIVKTLNNAGAAITLNDPTNNFAAIDLRARNALDTLNAAGAIAYRDTSGFDVVQIGTTSTVNLTAGGVITDSGAITGTTLTTSSVGGTVLDFGHTVTGFNATNITSGDVQLTNTAGTLTVTGVSETGGGNINVSNTGNVTVSGAVSAGGAGTVDLTASGATADLVFNGATGSGSGNVTANAGRNITINTGGDITTTGNVALNSAQTAAVGTITEAGTGKILTAALLTTNSKGGQTLNNANTVGSFNATNTTSGDIQLTNNANLIITGVSQTGGGNVTVINTGTLGTGGTISTAANGNISLSSSDDMTIANNVTAGGAGTIALNVTTNDKTLAHTANTISSTTGAITLTADKMNLAGTAISTGAGGVTLKSFQAADAIDLGSATDLVANTLELSNPELNTITTAGLLTIGNTLQTGAITVSAAINPATATGGITLINRTGGIALNDSLTSNGGAGAINLTADGGVGAAGIINQTAGGLSGGLLTTRSNGGTTLNGTNTVTSFNATNITGGDVQLTNTAGTLTITGISQAGGGDVVVDNTGALNLTTAPITTTANGNITLRALGGTLTLGQNVTAGGSGDVALKATGGTSDINVNGATVSSTTGNLQAIAGRHILTSTVTGTTNEFATGGAGTLLLDAGDSIGATANRIDTAVPTLAAVSGGASAAGDIFLNQTAGNLAIGTATGLDGRANLSGLATSANNNDITLVNQAGSLTLTQNVSANGTGVADLTGVGVTNNSTVTAAGGINVTATGLGSMLTNAGTLTNTGSGGAISLTADDMDLTGTITGGSGLVTLTSFTLNQPINIGAGLAALGLSEAEINTVSTTGQLTIGGATHLGTITVDGNANINNSTAQTLLIQNGGGGPPIGAIVINAQLTANPVGGPVINMDTPGSITGNPVTGLITADSYTIIQSGGIGSIAAPLQTNVNNLTAFNNISGDVVINNAKTVNLVTQYGNSAPSGEARLSTTNGSINTGTVNVQSAGGQIVLSANDNGVVGGANITVGAGGVTSNGGMIVLHAADNIDVDGTLTSNNGNIEIIAGARNDNVLVPPTITHIPGLLNGPLTLPATEATGDSIGKITLNALVNAGPGVLPSSRGNVVLISATQWDGTPSASLTNDAIVQTATGAIRANDLTAVALRGSGGQFNGGGAIKLNVATAPLNSTANINLFACPEAGCPDSTPTRSGAPFVTAPMIQEIAAPPVGKYADGPLFYTSSGTNISGVGTVNDFTIYTSGNYSLSGSTMFGRNLTFEGDGDVDINLTTLIDNNQISAGGTVKFVAGGNIRYNPFAAGATFGSAASPLTGRNLEFDAAGSIDLNNAIHIGPTGFLAVNANQNIAFITAVPPAPPFLPSPPGVQILASGTGDVTLRGNHEIAVGDDFTLSARNLNVLGGDLGSPNQQLLGERLNVGGTINLNLTGNMNVQAGAATVNSDSAALINAATINIGSLGARVNNLTLTGGTSNVTTPATIQHSDAEIIATGSLNVFLGAGAGFAGNGLILTGGSATVGAAAGSASQSTAIAHLKGGGTALDVTGGVTVTGGSSNAQAGISATAQDVGADASARIVSGGGFSPIIGGALTISGGTAIATGAGLTNAHAAASGVLQGASLTMQTGNLTLNANSATANASGGGTGTCAGGGGVCASASALIQSATEKVINVTGNLVFNGGTATANGAAAGASAIAALTDNGVPPPSTLQTVLQVNSTGPIMLTAGTPIMTLNGLASADATMLASGRIKISAGGGGLTMTGDSGGLFQNIASTGTIVSLLGDAPPVEVAGGWRFVPAVGTGRAYVLSGAPPSNLDPLQSALLSSLPGGPPPPAPSKTDDKAKPTNYCK